MALDDFKTDGPRTYKKNGSNSVGFSSESIHLVNGIDDQQHEFLRIHETHTVMKTPESMNVSLPNDGPYFICSECGKVSETFEGMVKSDLVDFKEKDWVDDALEYIIEEFNNISESKYYDGGLEDIVVEKDNDNSSNSSTTSTSSSSKTEEEFDSGLDSFLS